MIELTNVSKTFTLHNQGGAVLEVMRGANLSVPAGECVGLTGASGSGKSTMMRIIYGNYLAAGGSVVVGGVDVAQAEPREILRLRREVLVPLNPVSIRIPCKSKTLMVKPLSKCMC